MPEFTKEEYNQYKQSIIDTGKANNQIGYLYEFYLDNKDNMRFLKTKCYFAWNNQVDDLFKKSDEKNDIVHVVFKYKSDLITSTYHVNITRPTCEIFLLEENDELARQSIMEFLNRKRLEMVDKMSILTSITLETSADDKYFDTM